MTPLIIDAVHKVSRSVAGRLRLWSVLPCATMQVANHPDLVTAEFDKQNLEYPSAEQLIAECGKVALLDRMLTKLHAGGHKVRPCHPEWQS